MIAIPDEYYKKKIAVKLTAQEIEMIVDELESVPHNCFIHFGYKKLVDKLNKALENEK